MHGNECCSLGQGWQEETESQSLSAERQELQGRRQMEEGSRLVSGSRRKPRCEPLSSEFACRPCSRPRHNDQVGRYLPRFVAVECSSATRANKNDFLGFGKRIDRQN